MAKAAWRLPAPLVTSVLSLTVAKVDSMALVLRRCFPVLSGEVVERQQRVEL